MHTSGSGSSREQEVSLVCDLWEGLLVQGPLLRSVHGPSGLHQGHGSGLVVSSQLWHPNPLLFGLADPSLILVRGFVGKGHHDRPVSPDEHRNQPGQVSSHAIPGSNVSRHGTQEPDFEDFSGSGVGFSPFITKTRIFVLQQAISHFVGAC